MGRSGLVPAEPSAPESWDVRIRRQMIAPDRLQEVQARLAIVQEAVSHGFKCPFLVPVAEVTLSPLFLTLRADEAKCHATVGDRASYTLLPRGVDEHTAARLLRHVCLAVANLHALGVTHSHLSTGNVLWCEATARVVLLGHLLPISVLTPTSPLGVVSRVTAAPEILRHEPYGTAADVWSMGVLLLQMVLPATKSFDTADVEDTDLLSPLLSGVSATGQSFLLQCFKSDAFRRPSMADLLRHPLFQEVSVADGDDEEDSTSGSSRVTGKTSMDGASLNSSEKNSSSEDDTDSYEGGDDDR